MRQLFKAESVGQPANYPVIVLAPTSSSSPIVVDSPHSGSFYPDDFDFDCSLDMLRQTEDSYVDELVAEAGRAAGAIVIAAQFPRCFIDCNRAEDDIDPLLLSSPWPTALAPSKRTLMGLGLVRRLCRSGVPVYRRALKPFEVEKRIKECYRPYHAAVTASVARKMSLFGQCYLINCHSMPDLGGEHAFLKRPDMVLGDRNGESCDPAFTRRVRDLLQDLGYSVALNDPYKGVEIVRRYGKPETGQHALQLEINRRLYMNEQTLEKHRGFDGLRSDLQGFFSALAAELMDEAQFLFAAE